MKYLLALAAGLLVGALLAFALLVYNPLAGNKDLSPLTVSDRALMRFSYSGVPGNAIAYTNDGESSVKPHPRKILQLWEATVRRTDALMTLVTNSRGETVGVGIKYTSDSESTNLINGAAVVNSVWHLLLPGRGSMFIEQSENRWDYLRDVVLPAHWSSGNSWKGNWTGNLTSGPGALGTATVTGGSGEFEDVTAEAVESFTAEAYSSKLGPVALDGHITIEIAEPPEPTLAGDVIVK